MAGPRQYPHVSGIQDENARKSLRLLWDQYFDLREAHDATAATVAGQATSIGTLQSGLASTTALAQAAQATAGKITAPVSINLPGTGGSGSTGPPVGGSGPPTSDNGMGDQGCSAAGPTGHVPPGSPVNAFTVGQIVCGVAHEFPNLFQVAPDQATLDGWRTEYINRVIWHLNLAGYDASHYGSDPTSAGYTYLILVNIPDASSPNNQYAYRITNYDPTLQLQSMMLFSGLTAGGSTTPDGGTPD